MNAHHFISYSPADAQDFAYRLHDALCGGFPPIPAWLDKRDLKAGLDWDEQLLEAIRACPCLLFVTTRDSVEAQSVCKNEWSRALGYKKPVVPLRLHPDVEMPFRLGSRQYIDFSGDFNTGMARLRQYLDWLDSPEGKLQELKDRLADAQRDLRRIQDANEQARIRTELELLRQQITAQQALIRNPQAVAQRVEASIQAGLERERQPEKSVSGRRRSKFINPPPATAPAYFQDRYVETRLIGNFLRDEGQRLLTIAGRGGIGKTALVCRLLKALESGHLPDDLGELPVDGIVYLSATGTRQVNLPNLYADLSQLLPPAVAADLETVYKNPQASSAAKMKALLDNLENVVDPNTRHLADAELAEALQASLDSPPHAVKIILTTRLAPRDLALVHPERQHFLTLDEGLDSPYAENILREMDAGGKLGLRNAPAELLDQAKERTRGYPRALEALFAILSADRHTTLEEILAAELPDNVTEALVGEAYNRLDSAAQQVMQALAIYGRPVTPTAVDYLLQPYLPGLDSAPILNRLGNRYTDLGQTARAIEFYEQALAIDREVGYRKGEGIRLGNLGNCYADLGQTVRAIEFYEQALAIDREIGDRQGEAFDLSNLGDELIDQRDWGQAIQKCNQALQIADEISLVTIQNYARCGLALAHLYAGGLPAARAAVEAARQYDEPQNNHNVLALLGLVALRQEDQAAAQEAFTATVVQAEQLLAQTPHIFDALDAKGLALCGLSVIRWNVETLTVGTLNVGTLNVGTLNVGTLNVELENAFSAYRAARVINRDAGVVGRVGRLLEALAVVDSAGVVERVRAAAGEA